MSYSKSTHASRPNTTGAADWSDVVEIQQRLSETSQAIEDMITDVGMAKHVIEYDSDRRKRALAKAMQGPLKLGESASAADAYARASEGYKKEMEKIGKEHADAATVLTRFEASKLKWETARSLLSMCRTQAGMQ